MSVTDFLNELEEDSICKLEIESLNACSHVLNKNKNKNFSYKYS